MGKYTGASPYMIVIGGLLGSLAPIWAQNPVREREVPDAPSAQDISRFGKVVEAQAFVLRGSDGKVRGVLAADNKGQAGLELFDESGRDAMKLVSLGCRRNVVGNSGW